MNEKTIILKKIQTTARTAAHEWRYNMILAYLELAKLPEDCGYCPLNYDDMYCTAVRLPKGSGIRYDNVRPDWCPLGEVTLTTYTSKCVDCTGGYCEEECLEDD